MENLPEVTLTFSNELPGSSTIHTTTYHPYAHATDREHEDKVVFTPPIESFQLCRYRVERQQLPLRGFYQMKEISRTQIKFLLQLKLEPDILNEFDYCTVTIPFFNRPRISTFSGAPTAGDLDVRDDRHALVWEIGTCSVLQIFINLLSPGQRFSGRNLEVALPASLTFAENTNDSPLQSSDPVRTGNAEAFCTGVNAFVQIDFRVSEFSHRSLLAQDVVIFPKGNPAALTVERSMMSGRYIIWNSWGRPRTPFIPKVRI